MVKKNKLSQPRISAFIIFNILLSLSCTLKGVSEKLRITISGLIYGVAITWLAISMYFHIVQKTKLVKQTLCCVVAGGRVTGSTAWVDQTSGT